VSAGELKYPSWQTPLREAILEAAPEKLAKKIQEVEGAISQRLKAMTSHADHDDERQAIADATSILRVLKKEEL
jgi:hypothetical protein